VRKLGPNANPAVLKSLPLASGAMYAFYAAYLGYVMLGTSAPGPPAWQTPPETLAAVLHESANYFYVNIGLAQVGGGGWGGHVGAVVAAVAGRWRGGWGAGARGGLGVGGGCEV
jgi:hypothetical protein